MFFNDPNRLPGELILDILDRLPLKDAISFLTVSKEMQQFIKHDNVWKKFGADNFIDFVTRISKLPVFFRRSIIQGKYDLEFSENICNVIYGRSKSDLRIMDALVMLLPKDEYPNTQGFWNPYPIFKIVSPHYSHVIPDDLRWESMNNSMMCSTAIGFLEELISPEQMAKLDRGAIEALFYQNGIKALKNDLITPEEAAKIKPSHQLGAILTKLVDEYEKEINEPPQKKPRR